MIARFRARVTLVVAAGLLLGGLVGLAATQQGSPNRDTADERASAPTPTEVDRSPGLSRDAAGGQARAEHRPGGAAEAVSPSGRVTPAPPSRAPVMSEDLAALEAGPTTTSTLPDEDGSLVSHEVILGEALGSGTPKFSREVEIRGVVSELIAEIHIAWGDGSTTRLVPKNGSFVGTHVYTAAAEGLVAEITIYEADKTRTSTRVPVDLGEGAEVSDGLTAEAPGGPVSAGR